MIDFLICFLVDAVVGAIIGAMLAVLARLKLLKRQWSKTNDIVAVTVSTVVVYVISFVLFAYLTAWAEFGGSLISLPSEAYETYKRIEHAIVIELWLRNLLGPECGPCHVLDGVYIDDSVRQLQVDLVLGAMSAGLTGGLVFYYLTRKLLPIWVAQGKHPTSRC